MRPIPRLQFSAQRLAAGIVIIKITSTGLAMTATLKPRRTEDEATYPSHGSSGWTDGRASVTSLGEGVFTATFKGK